MPQKGEKAPKGGPYGTEDATHNNEAAQEPTTEKGLDNEEPSPSGHTINDAEGWIIVPRSDNDPQNNNAEDHEHTYHESFDITLQFGRWKHMLFSYDRAWNNSEDDIQSSNYEYIVRTTG